MSVASIAEFKATWKTLVGLLNGRTTPRDRIEAALFGYTEEEWQSIASLAKSLTCDRHGKCHGVESFCVICGDVSRTCHEEGRECLVHRDAVRCGKTIATSLGYLRCACRPGFHDCSGIQEEWFAYRELLRAP